MAEDTYELIRDFSDIERNIQKFLRILEGKEEACYGEIIKKFSSFDYWYFIPILEIFIPNIFLGYRDCANKPYPKSPKEDYGMDGGKARVQLKEYFNAVDENEYSGLHSELMIFAHKFEQKIKKKPKKGEKIGIFVLKNEYRNIFEKNLHDPGYNDKKSGISMQQELSNREKPMPPTRKKTYISAESAKKYYKSIIEFHKIEFTSPTKISTLKNMLENEILAEASGFQHYYDKTENGMTVKGQKTWLLENKEKNRDRRGIPESGDIQSVIVSSIITVFEQRNIAEHDKEKITYATYLGIFDTVAKSISFFSGMPIPGEILEICNQKKY